MAKKEKIKPSDIRKISQVLFIVLTIFMTYLFYSRGTAICWLDPFWHLQTLFANKDISTTVSFTEHYIGDFVLPSVVVLGVFIAIALLFGRIFCGWMCPFGTLLQCIEKISPVKGKLHIPHELKDPEMKYVILAGFLLLSFITNQTGFCEFCPAGTIFKGMTGHIIIISLPVFISVVFIGLFYGRKAWCSYLCPLGAFFGLFSKIQIFGIKPDGDCVKCLMCNKACPMDILVAEKYIQKGKPINDGDCIKCMNCIDACPRKILKFP